MFGDAGIAGVGPHVFGRTGATAINEQASVNLAAELLGHTEVDGISRNWVARPPRASVEADMLARNVLM